MIPTDSDNQTILEALSTGKPLNPDYGGYSETVAAEKAKAQYLYEPPENPYRGLIFHDLAWHWAMLQLHGAGLLAIDARTGGYPQALPPTVRLGPRCPVTQPLYQHTLTK